MKLFSNKQLLLRIVSVSAESVLAYIIFLFANQIAGGSRVSIIFFLFTALCGLLVNLLPYNNSDKHIRSYITGSIGLTSAIMSIGLSAIFDFEIFTLPIAFIALAFLYYRSYVSYISNILYVYTAGSFYQSIVLLFIVNALLAFWSRSFGVISEEIMRYSVLYIVMAVYMLSEIKNFRYVSKSENSRRTIFDIAAASMMILITVIMSVPRVFKLVTLPFAVVFKFVYGWMVQLLLLLTYPIARLFNYIYDLIEVPLPEGAIKPNADDIDGVAEKYREALQNYDSAFVELIGKVLAFAVMLAICAVAVYFLFKFLNRLSRKDEELDFVEQKEFIIKDSRKKSPGIISKLADRVRSLADGITFMLNADNRDKLRNEYRSFVQKLHERKVLDSCDKTAQEINNIMLNKLPEQKQMLMRITEIYEEVRYGDRYPEDSELKDFRKSILEISKKVL